MVSVAVIVANAHYTREDDLECCLADREAMTALIKATGRFTTMVSVVDVDGDGMRAAIRDALDTDTDVDELFFYYSGHGAQVGNEFFYCGTTFDSAKPNQTGLSHTDLHDMLRAAKPGLLVKVVDACASGTLLVKGPSAFAQPKDGFRNFVQLASCMNDQNSFGGEPLSAFTKAFCDACIRKEAGPIYYADVVNSLRDDFLDNDEQTPFFVSQGTAREMFIDDAQKLSNFRGDYASFWAVHGADVNLDQEESEGSPEAVALLRAAEATMAGPEEVKNLIDGLSAELERGIAELGLDEYYDQASLSYPGYYEDTTREFIIRILLKEARPDRFVTAEAKTKHAKRPMSTSMQIAMGLWDSAGRTGVDYETDYDLEINLKLERVQFRFTLTPKFKSLQQVVLILSFAPSLERCFIFELGTFRLRSDWSSFEENGREYSRRWWKLGWDESFAGISTQILNALEDAARSQIDDVVTRLSK